MNWIGGHDRHKQAIFVEGRYKNHIQAYAGHMGLLLPPFRRQSLALDNPLVKQASRRSIREAGVGNLVTKLVLLSETTDPSLYGRVSFVATRERAPHGQLEVLEQHTADRDIPGGKRVWYVSRGLALPVLVQTFDKTGTRIGHYEYRDFKFNIGLTDDDFDPNKVYK